MDASTLIECWEHGRRRHALDRALLLYAAAAPDEDPETLADRPLGARNAALLRLRQSLFGDALNSCVECPECGEPLEFTLSAAEFLARDGDKAGGTYAQIGQHCVRLPTTRDLASVAQETNATNAERKLLGRLLGDSADAVPTEELAHALDAADPCMDISLALSCPACAHEWNSPLDVPAYLWQEIDAHARRLIDEVHVLARAYGWSETEILALSETRREAYLERVTA